jgi:hypothetical protein
MKRRSYYYWNCWRKEGFPIVALILSNWSHSKDGMSLTWIGNLNNFYYSKTLWLRYSFWKYIFEKPKEHQTSRKTIIWCRLRGHPDGEIFYNPGGMEPDHRCKNCLELIG